MINNTQILLAGILSLVLVAGMTSPAFAGVPQMCTLDEYDSGGGICLPLTVCTGDEFESTAPTEFSDRTCSPLTASPVAGELLSVNSSALVISGLASGAMWMVPAVAGVAGAGIYLVKFRSRN